MKRAAAKIAGFGLIEVLVTLAITGMLLALLSSVLFQAATAVERQKTRDRLSETETVARLLLQTRLDAIALVAQEPGARRPQFEVANQRLLFVTRFSAPSLISGLWQVVLDADPTELRITLSDWPDGRRREEVTLALPDVRFEADGMDSLVDGLPRAVTMTLPGGPVRLDLGAQLPLDCVIPLPTTARAAGGLLCPGRRQ